MIRISIFVKTCMKKKKKKKKGWCLHLLKNVKWTGTPMGHYLTLRSVLSLNNPQNSEMKSCENMKLTY